MPFMMSEWNENLIALKKMMEKIAVSSWRQPTQQILSSSEEEARHGDDTDGPVMSTLRPASVERQRLLDGSAGIENPGYEQESQSPMEVAGADVVLPSANETMAAGLEGLASRPRASSASFPAAIVPSAPAAGLLDSNHASTATQTELQPDQSQSQLVGLQLLNNQVWRSTGASTVTRDLLSNWLRPQDINPRPDNTDTSPSNNKRGEGL